MAEICGGLSGSKRLLSEGDGGFQCVNGSGFDLAELLLELCPTHLDGVEVGLIGRQVADSLNELANHIDLVGGQVVHHDDVPGLQ